MFRKLEVYLIKPDVFFAEYRNVIGPLNQIQVNGLNSLITAMNNDPIMSSDPRWLAYALATIMWEADRTFQPIPENGRGKGHSYGIPDPITGQTYYGRGYVQLTWKANYAQ